MQTLAPYKTDDEAARRDLRRAWIIAGVTLFCLFYGLAFGLLGQVLALPLTAPLVVMALVAIWALPGVRTAPVGTLRWLLVASMVSLVLWPDYLALALPGLPWITMVRLANFPLVIVFLLCLSQSRDFRSQLLSVLTPTPGIWKVFLAFVAYQTLSIGLSHNPFFSVDRWLVAQISWTAVFFASAYVFMRPGRVERMASVLWVMAIIIFGIGVMEWRHSQLPWANHIPSFLQIDDDRVRAAIKGGGRASDGVYRVKTTFSTSLGLGEYLALTMPFVVHFAVGQYRWPIRTAALATIPLLLFLAKVSGSRLGLIGCLLALLFYGGVWAVLRWKRHRTSLLAAAVTLAYPAFGALALASTFVVGRIRHVVWGTGSQQFSDQSRKDQWHMGIPKLLSHPQGHGIGMGGDALGYFTPQGLETVDSYYLTVLMEYGFIGFILYFGTFLFAIYYAGLYTWNNNRNNKEYTFLIPLAIAVTNFFIVKSVFSEASNHPLVFMMLGMISALVWRMHEEGVQGHLFPARAATARARTVIKRRWFSA